MGLIDDLNGRSVFVDTPAFIYYLQNHAQFAEIVAPVFEAIDRGDLRGVSSSIVLCELLAKPLADGDDDLVHACRACFLNAEHFEALPISVAAAEAGARLRAEHNLRTPDALNLAAARCEDIETFLTNDHKLRRVTSPEVLVISDYV